MSIDLSTYTTKVRDIERLEKADIKQPKSSLLKKRFGNKQKAHFYKEFAGLLTAGVDFKRALEILEEQQSKQEHKKLIASIKTDVIAGKSLNESLMHNGKFTPYEYFSIKIGEESRNLDSVLPQLQRFFERKIKMRRQMISVFTYPAFVLTLTFGVLFFMMKYVVPMFATVFKQFDKELPPLTQKIIYLSSNFGLFSGLFVLGILLLVGAHFYFKDNDTYRKTTSNILLKLPFVGKLVSKIYITRFCRSLSLLLTSKTPLVKSLGLVQKMISFYPIEFSLEAVKWDITKGMLFSDALQKHSIYSHKLISLIRVAEHTNSLDKMFERLAIQYDEESQHQTKMIGVVMEPLLILIIGIVVGTVLIAMYSPMFDLSKILENG